MNDNSLRSPQSHQGPVANTHRDELSQCPLPPAVHWHIRLVTAVFRKAEPIFLDHCGCVVSGAVAGSKAVSVVPCVGGGTASFRISQRPLPRLGPPRLAKAFPAVHVGTGCGGDGVVSVFYFQPRRASGSSPEVRANDPDRVSFSCCWWRGRWPRAGVCLGFELDESPLARRAVLRVRILGAAVADAVLAPSAGISGFPL